jgi:hypothetical protein
MELAELPLNLMSDEYSSPTQEGLEFLDSKFIPFYINKKYESPEDRADAFDGAFVGFYIYQHLSAGSEKQIWLDEILCWHDWLRQSNLKGPFHDGLKATLDSSGLGDFYSEALDYIRRKEGVFYI